MGVLIVKLTRDTDISMPLVPSVSGPEPLTAMSEAAPATLIPPHEIKLFIVSPAPNEVLVHVAMLPAMGGMPPVQLTPAVKSVPVAALMTEPTPPMEVMVPVTLKLDHL